MKKIYLASDHAGFELKASLSDFLQQKGYETEDLGPHALQPDDDYPDYIFPLAEKVAADSGSLGIAIGGSGEGEAMAANRIEGVRATAYYGGSSDIVRLSKQHNDANILSLGARFISDEEAKQAVSLWLETPFSGDERHIRRNEELDHGV